jgi:TolB protein
MTRIIWLAGAVTVLAVIASSVPSVATVRGASGAVSPCSNGKPPGFHMEPTIALTTTRDDPDVVPPGPVAEIYLIDPDGSNPRRLTDNDAGDGFPNLSPDGKKVVFDSARISGRVNVSDLFLMNADGSDQTFLTRGSSATWSPDCKNIAFHASASGTGTPLRTDPGSATTDSDLFVANVDDLLVGDLPTNLTDSPDKIDDDADWSPDGQRIAYTAHDVGDDPPNPPFTSNTAEIYITNADGSGTPQRVTENTYEERAVNWSPDGSQIVFSCRTGGGATVFHICVKDVNAPPADPPQQLTASSFGDLTATWSPDGSKILFHRNRPPLQGGPQLFVMNADGTDLTQLTSGPGVNQLAHWGMVRVHDRN